MTNPDRDELVKLADRVAETPAYTAKDFRIWRKPILHRCDDPDGNSNASVILINAKHREAVATALRRLASSEGGVKGEPEPVAWIDFADNGNVRLWTSEKSRAAAEIASGRKMTPVYTAPPADAGMREAFVRALASLAAAISILERTPKAKKAVASDKMFDTMLNDYRKELEAGRAALTALGATTKSNGGEVITAEQMDAIEKAAVAGQPLAEPFADKVPCHCHDAVSQRLCLDKDRCYTVEAQPVTTEPRP